MREFSSKEDVDTLTDEEALEVVANAGAILIDSIQSYGAVALDDRGDYLSSAIENYHRLFDLYWTNDGQNPAFLEGVKQFLREEPHAWLASDGDLRFNVFTNEYIESFE